MRFFLLFALIFPLAFQAVLGAIDGPWTYTVSNNQATITAYAGAGGAVAIPSVVNGIPVVKVGDEFPPIFSWNNSVTSVIIPNGVTSIGNGAFAGCKNLTSITIPSSVTSFGHNAFYNCTSLTSVTIPNGVTSIGGSAFNTCSALASITIPNGVTNIGDDVFLDCTALASVTIPNSVTRIGNGAFYGCTSLTSINIPNSVTSIGYVAFASCTSLTSVTLPNSVTSIGDSVFSDCTALASVTIPNSVTSIGQNAFFGCTSLTSVTMPVSYIGQTTQIGMSGQVASDYIINALANNDAFVTAVANKIKATSGNYGLSIKAELESLATKTELGSLATKTELTSSLAQSRTDGINSVLSNPNLWTLYTTSQIQNMAIGDLVLTRNVAGALTLNYDIEQSTDLVTWTTYQAFALPLEGLPTNKAFVRIKAKQ